MTDFNDYIWTFITFFGMFQYLYTLTGASPEPFLAVIWPKMQFSAEYATFVGLIWYLKTNDRF